MDSLTALGAAALLAPIGMALYVTGLVRAKNSSGAVLRMIADICLLVLGFWAVGIAIMFQTRFSFLGIDPHLLFGRTELRSDSIFFHMVMILTASGIVSGAVAERFKFMPLCAAALLLGVFIFPVAYHWAWSGWLVKIGFRDVGGATIFHVSAAAAAAAGAVLIGPREGKFNRDGSSNMLPGHNVPFASLGALLMLAGFIPYAAGAGMLRLPEEPSIIAGRGAINVLLCAASACVASMVLSHLRYRKIDIGVVLMGFLGGVVASVAGAGVMSTQSAVATGIGAGAFVPFFAVSLDLRFRIDDPAGVIAVHGIGGAWGTIAFALFIGGGTSFHQRMHFLLAQIIGVISVALFAAVTAGILLLLSRRLLDVRPREEEEFDGLDLTEHDIGAYPDFQQTTIKSYHLREA